MVLPMMRRLIFPAPTSILAFVSLRNGHPSISGIPRSSSISRTIKFASVKVFLTFTKRFSTTPSGYPTVESASWTHMVVGEQIAELLKCYLGHDVDTSSKVAQSVIKFAIKDLAIDHRGSRIISYCGCQFTPRTPSWSRELL